MNKYSKQDVYVIMEFIKLQGLLPSEIEANRTNIMRQASHRPDVVPEGIEFSFAMINDAKHIYEGEGWTGHGELFPVGPGAIAPYSVVLVNEYIRTVELSRKYPEFSRLPKGFDRHYDTAKWILIWINQDDVSKDFTLEAMAERRSYS